MLLLFSSSAILYAWKINAKAVDICDKKTKRYSYAVCWEAYVKGHIMSITSLRYIQNILTATAATKTEDTEDSSDDTDAEQYENFDFKAGNMDLVH